MCYCNDCIHYEVCGEENARDPAIKYCGEKITKDDTFDKFKADVLEILSKRIATVYVAVKNKCGSSEYGTMLYLLGIYSNRKDAEDTGGSVWEVELNKMCDIFLGGYVE